MYRTDLIQRIIDEKRARTYLEIGVSAGDNFLRIKAKKKIAVDPRIKIRRSKHVLHTLLNPCNLANEYCEMTSDRFFETRSDLLTANGGVDVAFVDGLHTYEQALRDVEMCLEHLNPGGIIVMHDCSPPNAASAHPAESRDHAETLGLPGWTGEWCGDTFKAVLHLRATRDDLDARVFDADYGLGVVRRGEPESSIDYTPAQIEQMPFEEFAANRERLLHLEPPARLEEWIATL